MTPLEGLYLRSRVIHGDLATVDEELSGKISPRGTWFPFVKLALVALGNLADLDGVMRPTYLVHQNLSATIKTLEPDLLFAKYLRNVFGGHLNEALFSKAYEWRPELRKLPEIRQMDGTVALNLFVLETAINTYVAADGSHGMFASETDLIYPPDMERFCEWLAKTIRSAVQACDLIAEITHTEIQPIGDGIAMFDAFKDAGLTTFNRIKKGRQ